MCFRAFVIVQAMGGDVSWTWMPSPLNAAAYMFADLITIESDAFSASKAMFNCVTLRPSKGSSTGTMWHESQKGQKNSMYPYVSHLASVSIHLQYLAYGQV